MLSTGLLSGASTGLTCCLQIAWGWSIAWVVCLLVRNRRLRVKLWTVFLCVVAFFWLASVLIPRSSGTPESVAAYTAKLNSIPSLYWSWQLPTELLPKFEWLVRSIEWLYLLVVIGLLLQWWLQSRRLKDLLRNVRQPSGELEVLFQKLCSDFEVPSCRLEIVDGLHSPATACWRRPRVLLPAQLIPRLEIGQLADVLRHELAHVRGRDYLWNRVASLGCRILFFHPAVWLAYRQLRHEMEFACDEAVAGDQRERRLAYADCLLRVARLQHVMQLSIYGALDISSSKSLLATRVNALMSVRSSYSRPERIAAAPSVILGLLVLPSVGISLHWSAEPGSGLEHRGHQTPSSERRPLVSKKRTPRSRHQRAVEAQLSAVPTLANSDSQQVAFITTGLGQPTLPSLADRSEDTSEPTVDPVRNADSHTSTANSGPVWDESQVTGLHKPKAPFWSRVAVGIVEIAGAVISQGEDPEKVRAHKLAIEKDH